MITETLEYETYVLYKDTYENIKHINNYISHPLKGNSDFSEIIELPNLKKSDIENLNLIIKSEIKIEPNNNQNTAGNREIYLLVDEDVYSASESFTVACKETKFANIIGKNKYWRRWNRNDAYASKSSKQRYYYKVFKYVWDQF